MFHATSLKRNVTSNLGGYAVSVVIAFIISPIVIRSLGDEQYGVWALVAQLTGYYGLFDLGIRGAITHYTARFLAQERSDQLRGYLATGFWALAGLGFSVLFLGLVLTVAFPWLFDVGETPVSHVRCVMLVMTFVIALNFPMTAFDGVLVAHERLDLVNGADIVTRILGAFATYFVMTSGGGIVGLAFVQCGVSVGRWCLVLLFVRPMLNALNQPLGLLRRSTFRDLCSYGGRSMIINVSLLVIYQTDLIVIGAAMGTAWVTIYAIGLMLVRYMSTAGSAVSRSFTPRLTRLAAKLDSPELIQTYLTGARTVAVLVAPLSGCMFAFGSPFIALWLGQEYVIGEWGERSDVIMILLLIANVPRVLQSISWQLLFATNKQGVLARLCVFEAVANLALSLLLVQSLGLIGVALGTLLPIAVTHGILLPQIMARTFGISAGRYFVEGIGRPVLVGIACCFTGLGFMRIVPPQSWAAFLGAAVITLSVGMALIYLIVLREEERRHLTRLLTDAFRGKSVSG